MMLNHSGNAVDIVTFTKAHFRPGYVEVVKQGYEDYLNNAYNELDNRVAQLLYERGRAFAVYCKVFKQPKAIWSRQGKVPTTLVNRFLDATKYGFIL